MYKHLIKTFTLNPETTKPILVRIHSYIHSHKYTHINLYIYTYIYRLKIKTSSGAVKLQFIILGALKKVCFRSDLC